MGRLFRLDKRESRVPGGSRKDLWEETVWCRERERTAEKTPSRFGSWLYLRTWREPEADAQAECQILTGERRILERMAGLL